MLTSWVNDSKKKNLKGKIEPRHPMVWPDGLRSEDDCWSGRVCRASQTRMGAGTKPNLVHLVARTVSLSVL